MHVERMLASVASGHLLHTRLPWLPRNRFGRLTNLTPPLRRLQEPVLPGAHATHPARHGSQRAVLVAAEPALRDVAHHPVSCAPAGRLACGVIRPHMPSTLQAAHNEGAIAHREVNHGGLAQLYEILLESATAQITTALRLVLNAAEAGRNALLFCKVTAP